MLRQLLRILGVALVVRQYCKPSELDMPREHHLASDMAVSLQWCTLVRDHDRWLENRNFVRDRYGVEILGNGDAQALIDQVASQAQGQFGNSGYLHNPELTMHCRTEAHSHWRYVKARIVDFLGKEAYLWRVPEVAREMQERIKKDKTMKVTGKAKAQADDLLDWWNRDPRMKGDVVPSWYLEDIEEY